jgi:hypothetical protein
MGIAAPKPCLGAAPFREPLPLEAQEASYFAEDARMASFSPKSMKTLYTCLVICARGRQEKVLVFKDEKKRYINPDGLLLEV